MLAPLQENQETTENRKTTRSFSLSIFIPLVIVGSLIADVGLRFLPPERIAFRAWEAAILFPTADGPFTPNLVYHNEHAHGDLANLGNLRSLRVYRPEHFTTDAFGFRNTPASKDRDIQTLVVGDSFTGGAALSDSETITEQLAEMTHTGVYNCGDRLPWREVEKLINRLHLKGGLVIWELLERGRIEAPVQFEENTSLPDKLFKSIARSDSSLYNKWRGYWWFANSAYNPLRFATTQMFRLVQDDWWLPNVSESNVVVKPLKNGQQFIFPVNEVKMFGRKRLVGTDPYVQLQAAVRATGNQLLVLLIPDKYTVYYSLLDRSDNGPFQEDTTLADLTRGLQTRGVPALDLTQAFQQEAANALQTNHYLYWPDDTHWQPAGVKIAAQQVVKRLLESDLKQASGVKF